MNRHKTEQVAQGVGEEDDKNTSQLIEESKQSSIGNKNVNETLQNLRRLNLKEGTVERWWRG